MLTELQLVPGCELFLLSSNFTILSRDGDETLVEGACLNAVCKLLGKRSDIGHVVTELGNRFSYREILSSISDLHKSGLLRLGENKSEEISPNRQLTNLTSDHRGKSNDPRHEIRTEAFPPGMQADIRGALASQGIVANASADVILYFQGSSPYEVGNILAQSCWREGVHLLPVAQIGARLLVGPLFRSKQSPCWECLAFRYARNMLSRRFGELVSERVSTSRESSHLRLCMPENLAREVRRHLDTPGSAEVADCDLQRDTVRRHRVLQRSGCPFCGFRSPVLRPRFESNNENPPPTDYEKIFDERSHIVSPLTGVVTAIEDLSSGSNGKWFSYNAKHYFPAARRSVEDIIRSLKVGTGGKGETSCRAKLGALAEAAERTALIFDGSEERISSRAVDLEHAIDIRSCLNFSPDQYERRAIINSLAGHFGKIPREFDEKIYTDWTCLTSLISGQQWFLPTAYCYYGHPHSEIYGYCFADSNGCAAGLSQEDATLRALMELVERDAVAIWWYNRLRLPEIDISTAKDNYVADLLLYYRSLGREVWALDLTTDIGIPVVLSVSRRIDGPTEDIIFGSGAALCVADALRSAIAEMNQFLPAVMKHSADGSTQYRFPHPDGPKWWRNARISSESFLQPGKSKLKKVISDFADYRTGQLSGDVFQCTNMLYAQGLEAFLLDATRIELEFSVVRAVVPGLRHFWRRLGCGRLYDVPVNMGLLSKPLHESEFNQWSIFY